MATPHDDEPPVRSGKCDRCDGGEVCQDCLEHPDTKCECGDKTALHVIKGAPALDLPPLTTCPDCDGSGVIYE